jgi:hypothetical protein
MFVIKKAVDDQYYFVLQAKNNRVLIVSELYVSKSNALRGCHALKRAVAYEIRIAKLDDGKRQYYFVFKADNGEIVGTSELYKRKSNLLKGIKSALRNKESNQIFFNDGKGRYTMGIIPFMLLSSEADMDESDLEKANLPIEKFTKLFEK